MIVSEFDLFFKMPHKIQVRKLLNSTQNFRIHINSIRSYAYTVMYQFKISKLCIELRSKYRCRAPQNIGTFDRQLSKICLLVLIILFLYVYLECLLQLLIEYCYCSQSDSMKENNIAKFLCQIIGKRKILDIRSSCFTSINKHAYSDLILSQKLSPVTFRSRDTDYVKLRRHPKKGVAVFRKIMPL